MKSLLLVPSLAGILLVGFAATSPAFAMNVSEAVRLCRKTPDCVVSVDPKGHDILILGPKGGTVLCTAKAGGDCTCTHPARVKTPTGAIVSIQAVNGVIRGTVS